jgi:hypothetical protein
LLNVYGIENYADLCNGFTAGGGLWNSGAKSNVVYIRACLAF